MHSLECSRQYSSPISTFLSIESIIKVVEVYPKVLSHLRVLLFQSYPQTDTKANANDNHANKKNRNDDPESSH
jgi:hypothetical protein